MLVDAFKEDTGEYYIERNVKVASHILDYFVTGALLSISITYLIRLIFNLNRETTQTITK
jgi:hypothetical protein